MYPTVVAKAVVRHLPVLVVTSLLTYGVTVVEPDGLASPTTTATTTNAATIDDLILRLGDPDPRVRETATRELARVGAAAEAPLREAVVDGRPEAAMRARWLLTAIEFGLPVDTPPHLRAKLFQYQNADANERVAVGREILKEDDASSDVVVAAMWSITQGGPLLPQIEQRLAQRYERACRGMIYRGNDAGAARLLDLVVSRNPQGAGLDWAAFVVASGRADETVKRLAAEPSVENQRLLTYLHRAAGRPADALAAARAAESQFLLENMLYETARWAELSDHLDGLKESATVDRVSLRAATRRRAEPQREPAAVEALLKPVPAGGSWYAIKGLLLADCVDRAAQFAADAGNFSAAIELRCQQYRFDDASRLLADAKAKLKPDDVRALERWLVVAMHRNGLNKAAKSRVDGIRASAVASGRAEELLNLVALGVAMRDHDAAWLDAAKLLDTRPDDDAIAIAVVNELTGRNRATAVVSWRACRAGNPALSPAQTLAVVRDLYASKVSRASADRWLGVLAESADKLIWNEPRNFDRQRDWLRWSHRFGTPEAAARLAKDLMKGPAGGDGLTGEQNGQRGDLDRAARDLLLTVADVLIDTGHHAYAANVLERPSVANGFIPAVIYVRGWCLAKAGDEAEGRRLMELAPRLAMSDTSHQAALIETMTARGESDDAKRQRATFARTGAFRSWPLGNALRDIANDAAIRGQSLVRADLYDRWYLDTTDTSTSFTDVADFPNIAALTHGLRAKGLLETGDVDRARAEAKLCLAAAPARTDDLIDLVVRFDAAGRNDLGDELFDAAWSTFTRHRDAFPDEGQPHNATAWFAALCDRKMDDAERDARRAVGLEPDNAAFIDTLAEVRYRQGFKGEAIELIDRALKLRPEMKHLIEQRERFTGGK